MGKMTNPEIEQLAAHAINNEAAKPINMMEANIAVRDTKVSFDGTFELFDDRAHTKSNWRGFVNVQVKGTEVKKMSKGNITFSLDMEHYRNYYTNGGVIFFVVEVTSKGKTKIYYKILLLLDLKPIVSLDQKTKTITLTPLQGKTLRNICEFYLENKDVQIKSLIERKLNFDHREGETIITSPTYDHKKSKGPRDLLEHEWYVYKQHGKGLLPIGSAILKSLIIEEDDWKVSIGPHDYNFHIETQVEEHIISLVFDKTLKIIINNANKEFTFRMLYFNSISHQIKTLNLLLKMLEGHPLRIDDDEVIVLDTMNNSLIDVIEEIKDCLRILEDAEETMITLGTNSTTIFSSLPNDIDRIYDRLEGLNRVILHEEYHLLDMKGSQYLFNLNIGQVSLTIAWVPWHTQKIVSAFSPIVGDKTVYAGYDKNSQYPYSSYGLLSEKALAYSCNIDYEVIKRSFNRINPFLNEDVIGWTNKWCLNCITAYDLTEGKRKEVLLLALHLYNLNPYDPENKDMDIQYINMCQIDRRLYNELSSEQKRQLIKIKQNYIVDENPEIHFGCSVLLGYQEEAEYALELMGNEKLNQYKQYPIYTLYEQSHNQ